MPTATEREQALAIATAILDRTFGDPDGDIMVLARQMLRAQEEIDRLKRKNAEGYKQG